MWHKEAIAVYAFAIQSHVGRKEGILEQVENKLFLT